MYMEKGDGIYGGIDRKKYLIYPKSQILSDFLTWSGYVELLKIEDPMERPFYEKEADAGHWGVSELKRQMNASCFRGWHSSYTVLCYNLSIVFNHIGGI